MLDEALAMRLATEERDSRAAASGGPFARLDAALSGHAPRRTPDGLRYHDPAALLRAEMELRRREGLVN